jgi:hypothetical protein
MQLEPVRPHSEHTTKDQKVLRNLFWGLKWGLWFALFFSLIATAMSVFSGGEIIERQDISLPASIAIYVVGGLAGGAVLGLLRPLTRRRIGAALVGILVMTPVGMITGLILFGPIHTWDGPEWFGLIFSSILFGSCGGYLYWEPHEE